MKNKFTVENAAMLLIDHQQGSPVIVVITQAYNLAASRFSAFIPR